MTPHGRFLLILATALAMVSVQLCSAGSAIRASTVNVSVQVSGPGSVTGGAGAIACPATCTTSLALDAELQLDAVPASGDHFVGWSGGCEGDATRCYLIGESDLTVAAQFANGPPPPPPPAIPIAVSRSGGGSISSVPAGVIACGSLCSTAFSGGAAIQLIATPDVGFTFAGWSGGCSGSGACTASASTRLDAAATFTSVTPPPAGTSTVTLHNPTSSDPAIGGAVQLVQAGNVSLCQLDNCSYSIANGSTIEVDAVGGDFSSWGGGCAGDAIECVLAVTGPTTINATFIASGGDPIDNAPGLNVTRAGEGRVASTPPGIDCGSSSGCVGSFKLGTNVTLTATAAAGYSFGGWRYDCSGNGDCQVQMSATRAVVAVFRRNRDPVRVTAMGSGSGTVSSSPAGIDCSRNSSGSCQATFVEGSDLALLAAAAPGSQFAGWSGPCNGVGACHFTVTTSTTVGARFDPCAASNWTTFAARATTHPRRVAASFRLAAPATARLKLLRKGRLLAATAPTSLGAGAATLRLAVPPRAAAGPYRLAVRVDDRCGKSRTLSRTLRLRRR